MCEGPLLGAPSFQVFRFRTYLATRGFGPIEVLQEGLSPANIRNLLEKDFGFGLKGVGWLAGWKIVCCFAYARYLDIFLLARVPTPLLRFATKDLRLCQLSCGPSSFGQRLLPVAGWWKFKYAHVMFIYSKL